MVGAGGTGQGEYVAAARHPRPEGGRFALVGHLCVLPATTLIVCKQQHIVYTLNLYTIPAAKGLKIISFVTKFY